MNPWTQVVRQHTTSCQLCIQRILNPPPASIYCRQEPAQHFRASHNHCAVTTSAVGATAILQPTKTNDLGPHHSNRVHPFSHPFFRDLVRPQISFFIMFTDCMCGPVGSPLLLSGSLGRPQICFFTMFTVYMCGPVGNPLLLSGSLGPASGARGVLSLLHGTFFGSLLSGPQSFSFDFQGRPLSSLRYIKCKLWQPPLFLSRPRSFVFTFLLHFLFHTFEQTTKKVFHAQFILCLCGCRSREKSLFIFRRNAQTCYGLQGSGTLNDAVVIDVVLCFFFYANVMPNTDSFFFWILQFTFAHEVRLYAVIVNSFL